MDGEGMSLYSVATTDGIYTLCIELSAEQADLLLQRLEHMAEVYAAEAAEAETDDDDEFDEDWFPFADGVMDVSGEAPCWWFDELECENPLHCHCGPVTLLEVLTRTDAATRDASLARHMSLMEEMWSHYWSGQGLLEGAAATIGDACAECLINGAPHVYDVHGSACELAEELGEALSAFSTEIALGTPKWKPEPDLA